MTDTLKIRKELIEKHHWQYKGDMMCSVIFKNQVCDKTKCANCKAKFGVNSCYLQYRG